MACRVPPIRKLAPRRLRPPLTRSEQMARVASRDTKPELFVRAAVTSLGRRYRINVVALPGAPDLANKHQGWAIFVHGCFWHQHQGCRLASSPRSNTDYWAPKLARNQDRDAENFRRLTAQGFRVLILWECECRDKSKALLALRSFFAL